METCRSEVELNLSPLYLFEKLDVVDAVEVTRRGATVGPAQCAVHPVLGTEIGLKKSGRSGISKGPEAVTERSRWVRMGRFLRPTARPSGRTRRTREKQGA